MDEYTKGIQALETAANKKLLGELNARKTASLNEITPLEEQAKKDATTQIQNASVNSQLQAKNLAETLAQRRQTNAGIATTAELSRQNVLGRDISTINTARDNQLLEYSKQKANVNTAYNTDLTSGYNATAISTSEKLLAYKEQLRQEKLAREEQLRQEQVARDEATLAYRRSLAKASASKSSSQWDETSNTSNTQPTQTTTEKSSLQGSSDKWARVLNANNPLMVAQLKKQEAAGQIQLKIVNGALYKKV